MGNLPPFDLKRLRVQDGDILVIRSPHKADSDLDREFRAAVLDVLRKTLADHHFGVVFAQNLSDVKALGDRDLRKIGLVRRKDD